MFKTIRHFLELIRFSHTLFALPFALLAAVMAWHLTSIEVQWNDWYIDLRDQLATEAKMPTQRMPGVPFESSHSFAMSQLIGLLLCMVSARSFAMSVNRLADHRLDAENPRTAGRHIPAGILNVNKVRAFAAACAVVFVVSTLWFLPNWLPIALSFPVLAFLAGYSYTKRFTSLAHFWLGAALGLSPLAAWIAIRGQQLLVHPIELILPTVLGGAVLSWVAGFDIVYACQDYDADRKSKLYSVPVKFGIRRALRIAAACHIMTIAFLVVLAVVFPFGWIYWAGVAAVAALLIYEHLLVRPDDLSRVNAAFFNVNAVISIGLFLVGSLDLLLGGRGY